MSDNTKYYYIKLKDNYFDQDNVKVLESMKNGHIYSLILIKLYLRASKYNGKLMMTQTIPYEPNNIEILANVLNHDVDHVKEAIKLGVKLDLISIIDGREIWMTEIQNFIGQSSSEADRIRAYRARLEDAKTQKITDGKESVQMYDKSTPEIEIEIEIEKELKLNSDGSAEPKKQNHFTPPTLEQVQAYCEERNNSIDPVAFIAHYESKGWMIGKNKMKDWRAAVITWERNSPEVKLKKQAELEKRQEKQRLAELQEKWAREEEEQRLKAEADRLEAEERRRDADEFDRQLYGATIEELSERLRQRQGR